LVIRAMLRTHVATEYLARQLHLTGTILDGFVDSGAGLGVGGESAVADPSAAEGAVEHPMLPWQEEGQRLSDGRVVSVEEPFDSLVQVLQQLPAVGHLLGLGAASQAAWA
jgi:hypothetical protein